MLERLRKQGVVFQEIILTPLTLEPLSQLIAESNKSPQLVFLDLLAALQNGLIQPLSELDENLLIKEHKFLHDRVQQAAYALIDEAHKQVVHLQIGHNLLEKTLPEQLSERIFEIVDHLNNGIELITEQSERNEIARLNLIASQKAKAAIAIQNAKLYSKLRASESQMAQFLEAVPVGIGVVDALGRPTPYFASGKKR